MQGHPFDPRQDHLIDTIAGHTGDALDLTEIDDLCAGLTGHPQALAAHAA